MKPIVGKRFKCTVCPNFDYCENCKITVEHAHPFVLKNEPDALVDLYSVPGKQQNENIVCQPNLNQSCNNGYPTEEVHENVRCDGCRAFPIRGIRYKCTMCKDFDYCEKCEETKDHAHPFLKIKKAVHSTIINQNQSQESNYNPNFHVPQNEGRWHGC